jgi:RND superfamily putative drug exporter
MQKGAKSKSVTVRVAVWSARHKYLVLALWIFFTLGLFITGRVVGTKTYGVNDDVGLDRMESQKAGKVFDSSGGTESSETILVVVTHSTLKSTDPEFKARAQEIVNRLKGAQDSQETPVFSQVVDPVTALPFLGLTAPDGSALRIPATILGDREVVKARLEAVRSLLQNLRSDQTNGFRQYVYSSTLLNNEANELAAHELDGSLKVTIPATFLILLIAFGAVAAAVIPLLLATSALGAAFGILAIYSNFVTKVDSNATQLIVLIGLAVGIDYSLFMVTRYRTERRHGRNKLQAIEVSSSTAGRAVFFSGVVVIISLAGLFMIGNPIFTSMAIGTIGVVLVAIIGSLTFLPAVLSLLGNGVNWGRIPYFGKEKDEGSGFWSKMVGGVMRHPALFAILTSVLLLAMTYPMLHLKLGNNGLDGLPDSLESVKAIRTLSDKWPQGTTLRMSVVVTGANRPEVMEAVDKFSQTALQIKGLSGPPEKAVSRNGTAVRVSFLMAGNRNDEVNKQIVYKVRGELVPQYLKVLPDVEAYVSGSAAYTIDNVKIFTDSLPLIFSFVLGLSFVLLLVAFHSIVIPIKAIILNLLSTGASYGTLVLVFQEGWFSEQLGFRPTGVIESFVPIFLFTILFGLSMDYHLFILTRIKEAKDSGANSNEAVAKGISVTSGTITSAAAIMVVVFAVFVTLQIMIIKQLGLGLAVAVFIDATVIRSVLLPASMRLLGNWNWYMPPFLRWIPKITIEAEPEEEQIQTSFIEPALKS